VTKIVVPAAFAPGLVEKVRAVSSDLTIEQINLAKGEWPDDRTTTAEIFYATNTAPNPEQAPNLRWIQTHYAGVENLKDTAVWESDILITTASGIHAPNMAQYCMTQILAWAHRVPTWFRYQKAGKWPNGRWDKYAPEELRHCTLGIIGYGSIGRELARQAQCFGLKILVTKRDARHPEDTGYTLPGTGDPAGTLPHRIYPPEATRSMIGDCDYVVNTLPLTEKTHYFFNEELFRAMKPTAYFVNVGRGGTVNEKDLVRALRKGWIAGAGLDVFETEPLSELSPLWTMENVILTPHISGFTPEYDNRAIDLFAENLRRYLHGVPLLNQVSRETGY
jgi:phosphoglycerate dehydrogenase-like enzyme